MAMELDIIKTQTTWNDAAASLNNNFGKLKEAIAMGGGGGGSTIVVDTEMSDTSINPVQNKVVKKYIDDESVYLEGYAEDMANNAEANAKKYTDEKIAQIGSGSSELEEAEEVSAAALVNLDERVNNLSDDLQKYATIEGLESEVEAIRANILENEEVSAAALVNLDERIKEILEILKTN